MRSLHFNNKYFLLSLLIWFLLVPLVASAETIISNTISVSADSSDTSTSQASMKTVVNGEVIEDWSATSSDDIYYERTYTTENDQEAPASTTVEREALYDLLTRLQALIKLYVTLTLH
jgi:hypothetical protein